jgi:pimeloyl-ACP methyl ester carboxylesterase
VQFQAADGVTIHGTEYGKGARGVVLVHGENADASEWDYFATKLESGGFHVLAIDLRGHGASTPPEALDDEGWAAASQDVSASITWLLGRGATKVSVVGAGIGANLAVVAAADAPEVDNLVLLSPGMNLHGVMPKTSLIAYGQRPVLLVASSEDAYATKSATFLESKAVGPAYVEFLEDAGSGTRMLNRSVELEGTVVTWLEGKDERIEAATGAGRELATGETSDIETSGVKFGEEGKTPEEPETPGE